MLDLLGPRRLEEDPSLKGGTHRPERMSSPAACSPDNECCSKPKLRKLTYSTTVNVTQSHTHTPAYSAGAQQVHEHCFSSFQVLILSVCMSRFGSMLKWSNFNRMTVTSFYT